MASALDLLILLLVIIAVATGAIAVFARLVLRIGMRNVVRGRWRTILIVLGLLVGTTIVSGSLVIGDTVTNVVTHFTYQAYGYTDEAIYDQTPSTGFQYFPYSTFTEIDRAVTPNPNIAGIAPEILGTANVLDRSTSIPQPGLNLIAANANQTGALGRFTADNGTALEGPTGTQAYLDDQAAADLNATAGNSLFLVNGDRSVPVTVAAIVHDDTRGGFLYGGNVFVTLAVGQAFASEPGAVNFLAVTNAGSLTGAAALSGPVTAKLNATLQALGSPDGLAAYPILQTNLDTSIAMASSISTLFLVLGLFSIAAGALLIVGIFVMLAEERKGEMGMMRAIGLRRRDLVLVYYFEGFAYSVGSALAGTLLGVGVAYGMILAFAQIASSSSVTAGAIVASFTVSRQSLIIAYIVGFLLTLVTVVFASSRVSRLNIVRAIRSVPEPNPTRQVYTYVAALGGLMTAVGALLFWSSYRGSTDISLPITGFALVIMGLALVASRFVLNRYCFTAGAIGWLVWGANPPLHRALIGSAHTGTVFVLFVEGIILVGGAIMLYAFNSDLVVGAVTRLTRRSPSAVPVVRIGLSYPRRRPFRTAINLTIFAMVMFTIVAVASFGASVEANLNNTITADSGGYTFFGYSTTSIPNMPAMVASNATLAREFTTVVPMVSSAVSVGFSGAPSGLADTVYAPTVGGPASQNFYATNRYNFSETYDGLSSQAVFHELQTNASVAVADEGYQPGGISIGGGSHASFPIGTIVTLSDPANGRSVSVRVIGFFAETFLGGFWVNPAVATSLGISDVSAFYLTVGAGVSVTTAAQNVKAAFFNYGLILLNFAQIIQSSVQTTQAIVGLLEVFVALGLAVGIAGMGIVALRAVVERRTEIGMLRATGFTQAMILKTFLLEYSFVTLLGIGIGTVLGVVIDYAESISGSGLLSFVIPWTNILTVIVVAYVLTVAAIIGPSLKAARLPPAEAVRYTE